METETTSAFPPGSEQEKSTVYEPEQETEWYIEQTGQPAFDVISQYIFLDPWVRNNDQPRPPTEAVAIREREGGSPTGREQEIFGHNSKQGGSLEDALDQFFEDTFQRVDEPLRFILAVQRSPLPVARGYDSRKQFYVINRAMMVRKAGGLIMSRSPVPYVQGDQGVSGVPGIGQTPGVNVFAGPSPLGMNPAQFNPFPAGIHGDIGGTGIREMVHACANAFATMAEVVQKNQLFYADLTARLFQSQLANLARSPDREVELAKLNHEFRVEEMKATNEVQVAKHAETSGIARELGGKLLENPAMVSLAAGLAKKFGVDVGQVISLMKEE